ncbi:hypothetical protein [Nonomuraea typhae]|uniref:phage baseplate protein n=1 Tax=Nonomuraea typhae TaxID=2603600 RepID=UPI0012F847D1|nr:hypothetical protein [Nonomuraea typhae]
MFDLSGPWSRVLADTRLHHGPAMQSPAVDPVTHELYLVQLRDAGTADELGNLCVNRVSATTGKVLDWMHLDGFGHGYQIGAQHIAGRTHLWSEAGPLRKGFGTRVTRFPYLPGRSIDMTSDVLTKPYSPASDTLTCAPAVDPIGNWLTLRFRTPSGYFYSRHPINPATGKVSGTPAATIAHPPSVVGTFQGFATVGDLLYLYNGDPSDSFEDSNARISLVSWRDPGRTPVVTPVTALPGLPVREPEGLAVEPLGDRVRLLFGFSGDAPGPGRQASVCAFTSDPPVQGVKVLADWSNLTLADGFEGHTGARMPRARLISVDGLTQLQLRGSLSCPNLSGPAVVAVLSPWLTPSLPVRAAVPRNMSYGNAACQVEATPSGQLRVHGASSAHPLSWIDLDSFTAAWK